MANIKTAISIQENLFEQVDALARELEISRSRVFALAVEEFIQRYQNKQLLADLNQAYADAATENENTLRYQSRATHRQILDGDW